MNKNLYYFKQRKQKKWIIINPKCIVTVAKKISENAK